MVKLYCPKCNGTGEIIYICGRCGGSGEGKAECEGRCRRCKGSGEVSESCECDHPGQSSDDWTWDSNIGRG